MRVQSSPISLATLSLTELTAVYNKYAESPIKKFSCSKEAAIARIRTVMPTKPIKPAKPDDSTKRVAKISRRGIGGMVCQMLLNGESKEAVAAAIHAAYPDKVPGRSMKAAMYYVQWYIGLVARAQRGES